MLVELSASGSDGERVDNDRNISLKGKELQYRASLDKCSYSYFGRNSLNNYKSNESVGF